MKKIAGYIRVSTVGQKEGESLELQTEDNKGFAKSNGWELVKIYEDRGISGSKAKARPGFMEMMADAEKGKFEGIVFWKLSRFARNAKEFLIYRDDLREHGVNVFALKEGIDPTTKIGRMLMGMMALMAEWDSEVIRETMAENKTALWKRQDIFIGKPPFGYIWNKEEKKIKINKKEADLYRRMVSMYLDSGLSLKDICIKLSDEGVKCKAKPFNTATLSYCFKNPAYYGNYVLNKYKYDGSQRLKELKPADQHINFKIPAIITKIKWDKIQARTTFNKTKGKRVPAARPYWLRDLLECSEYSDHMTLIALLPYQVNYKRDKYALYLH